MDAVICGIDPGLAVTGYAMLHVSGDSTRVIDAGVCRFERTPPLSQRLLAVHRDITELLAEHRPDFIGIEDLYAHYNHPRTAILMGHARGVILQVAADAGIEIIGYASTRIKRYLTGNGHASKKQMQRAVQVALSLGELPEPHDVADALGIALCCAADVAQTTPGACA